MAIERKLDNIGPVAFISNGTEGGLVTISDTRGFKVKAEVVISANTLPNLILEVKRVLSETQFLVGEKGKIQQRAKIQAYTVALGATVHQPEQDRPGIPIDQHERAVFAEEPILAKRVIAVDEYGNYYNEENPFPVGLELSDVEVNVDLEAFDEDPDSILAVGSEDGTKTGTKHVIRVDTGLDVRVGISNGNLKATLTEAKVGPVTTLDTVNKNKLFSKPLNKIEILSKNDDGNPIQVRSSYNSVPVQLLDLSYDSDGDLLTAEITDL